MAWRISLLGLLTILSTVTSSAALSQRVQSDQDILIQLERDWDTASRSRDVQFIERLLADEFIATYADWGRGDKAEELARAAQFDQQIESSTLDDFTVKIYGDTAVVWMTKHLVGPSKGQRLKLTFRYVDVFVLREGRWQCVASQSAKVTAATPS